MEAGGQGRSAPSTCSCSHPTERPCAAQAHRHVTGAEGTHARP